MSLINDALKRAKVAQQTNPLSAAPDLPLRPVEPERQPRPRTAMLLPMVFGVVLALVAVLLWQGSQRRAAPPQTALPVAKAVLPAPVTPATVAAPPPAVSANQTVFASQPASPLGTSLPAAGAPEADAKPPAVNATPVTGLPPTAPSPASNAVPVTVAAAAPQPAPLKLQGILYRPTNPVAVINGKTVGVGDRVDEAIVVSINQSSTLVVVAGETNKLSLPQ